MAILESKTAVISDIHANLPALDAVLRDISAQDISTIVCLGDLVGYGAQPSECIGRALQFDACLLGNHDLGILYDQQTDQDISGEDQARTKAAVLAGPEEHWDFLCKLPRTLVFGDWLCVHASPRQPVHEYIFPEDIHNTDKIARIFSLVKRYCLVGHTHMPGIFLEDGAFLAPAELGGRYQLDSRKTIINVGSVGLPRDGDDRACYAVIDDGTVEFRRLDIPA